MPSPEGDREHDQGMGSGCWVRTVVQSGSQAVQPGLFPPPLPGSTGFRCVFSGISSAKPPLLHPQRLRPREAPAQGQPLCREGRGWPGWLLCVLMGEGLPEDLDRLAGRGPGRACTTSRKWVPDASDRQQGVSLPMYGKRRPVAARWSDFPSLGPGHARTNLCPYPTRLQPPSPIPVALGQVPHRISSSRSGLQSPS